MAPLKLRRDISLLGFLQKRVLGMSHPSFASLFPFAPWRTGSVYAGGRPARPRHNKQLRNHHATIMNSEQLWRRSVFSMVFTYNRLPQDVVDLEDVSEFQTALTNHAKSLLQAGVPDWELEYDSCKNCLREGRYSDDYRNYPNYPT